MTAAPHGYGLPVLIAKSCQTPPVYEMWTERTNLMNALLRSAKKSLQRFWLDQQANWKRLFLLFKPEPYPTLLSRDFKDRYRLLTNLHLIDEGRKQEIDAGLVMYCSRRLAKLNFDEERLHAIRKIAYDVAKMLFILLIGEFYRVTMMGLGIPIQPLPPISSFFAYSRIFGPVIILLLLFIPLFSLLADRISFSQRLSIILAILAIGILLVPLRPSRYQILGFGLAGFQTISLISIGIDILIDQWYRQHIINNIPEAVIAYNLLLILKRLEDDGIKSFYAKRMFVTRLEHVAVFMEKHIFKRIRTSDERANLWMLERMQQIATAIRDKKKWIYTPKVDTTPHLATSLSGFLIHFLRNEWDALERSEVPTRLGKRDWVTWAGTTLRTLVLGLSPVGVLLVLRERNMLSMPFGESLIGIAIIWAIVSLLWLDPSAKDKINALKDATSIIAPKN